VAAIAFAPAGVFEDNLDTYDLDFQHHFRLNARHRLIWGLAYRRTHDVVDNAPSVAFFPSVLDQDLYSGFVQDEILVRDDLYLAVGTKLEHNDYTGFEVEPDVRMRWTVRPNQLLWAAVSRAVRTPSRIDHDVALPAPSTGLTILAGGQDFESESVTAYQLGYRGQVGPRLSASVSTFYNRYDDIRSTSPSDNPTFPGLPFPFVFRNDVEGDTYGVELASDYQPIDRLRLHAGYTFLREHLRVKTGKVDINAARNETADPEQQLSVRAAIDLGSRIELNASLRWVDTLHLNRGTVIGTVPSYVDLDLRLGWHVTPELELSVASLNLLHDRHPEYGFPSPSRVEIERSVFGWLAWHY
jgi:iron complex outermembrane receptor protein